MSDYLRTCDPEVDPRNGEVTQQGRYIVDTLMAHMGEKVSYEQLLSDFPIRHTRAIIKPTLSDRMCTIRTHMVKLRKLGFEVETFRGTAYRMTHAPEWYVRSNLPRTFWDKERRVLTELSILIPTLEKINSPKLERLLNAWRDYEED